MPVVLDVLKSHSVCPLCTVHAVTCILCQHFWWRMHWDGLRVGGFGMRNGMGYRKGAEEGWDGDITRRRDKSPMKLIEIEPGYTFKRIRQFKMLKG